MIPTNRAHFERYFHQLAVFALINLLLIGVVAWAASTLIVSARGLRFDFTPHLIGGRAVWNGDNPYTPEVTARIQQAMFGRALPPEADQQNLAYPAYSSLMLAPILALPDQTAIAVWMAVQFVALLWSPVLWLNALQWQPPPWIAGGLVLALLFVFRYPMDVFVLGQFTGTVLLALSLGFWLLVNGRDALAGVVFVAATVPPTTGLPIALALLVAHGLRGRWRGLVAFMGTLAALLLVSVSLIGNWFPDYVDILTAYSGYAEVAWAVGELRTLPLQAAFVVALVTLSLWMLWRFWKGQPHAAVDLMVMAVVVALLLLPQTGEYVLTLLIPALVACLAETRRLAGVRAWLVRLSVILVVLSAWVYPRGTLLALVVPLHVLLTWCFAAADRWIGEAAGAKA
ncbi:MAG: hypothetical protein OHK0046_08940 [Anaerolineae bacterium]